MIGELIGNHRVIRRLGEGGMGEVYLAEQQSIGTQVAIKVLFSQISAMKDQVQRFFNEARAVARIRHAGICKIFDVGFTGAGQAYLMMELLDGQSLSARVAQGPVPLAELCEISRQIASVLAATHAACITHRDLKPDNVFLVPDHELESGERVKVLDFGIAKLTGTIADGSPRTFGTMGTPGYMSPEQWGDSSKVDARADIYSLGCMVFEMACGRPPFEITTIADACAKHLNERPPAIRSLAPELPPELDDLVARMLAKSPDQRPQTMQELTRAFEALAEGRTAPVVVASPTDATLFGSAKIEAPAAKPARPTTTTTLGGAVGEATAAVRPRNRTLMIGAVLMVGVGGGTLVALRVLGGDDKPPAAAAAQPTKMDAGAASVPAVVPPDAAVAPPSLAERVAAANPFVAAAGLGVQTHQVSRREYAWFLDSLSGDDATRFAPLADWTNPTSDPSMPVAWIAFEQAARFCSAIDASLPTSAQWATLAGKRWGLDPSGAGPIGPLQEWTSTVDDDGYASVRGGHARQKENVRQRAAGEILDKPTLETAGAQAKPESVAGVTIGFRCVR